VKPCGNVCVRESRGRAPGRGDEHAGYANCWIESPKRETGIGKTVGQARPARASGPISAKGNVKPKGLVRDAIADRAIGDSGDLSIVPLAAWGGALVRASVCVPSPQPSPVTRGASIASRRTCSPILASSDRRRDGRIAYSSSRGATRTR